MPLYPVAQNSFSQGELGPYMGERADNPLYHSAAQTIQNYTVLPHGGLKRRPGFVYIATLAGANADETALALFNFDRAQQYVLGFTNLSVAIFRDNALVSTVVTPFLGSELADLRWTQSGDTMILVHPSHPPQRLDRVGSDASWTLGAITFSVLPWHRYDLFASLTPSATAGAINLTLSTGGGFWNAGHASGAVVRVNSGTATMTGFTTDASGGTAASAAGTAANAFDGNTATITSAGVSGWVGYQFSATTSVRIVGINANTTATYTLVCETATSTAFASPVTVATLGAVSLTAGTMTYFDVTSPTSALAFRIRETGGASFAVKDLIFSKGLVATGTVIAGVTGTGADAAWTEQAWNPGRGYPRSCCFHENRLVFGGTRDAPETVFGSKTGDFFNFDDALGGTVHDDNAFSFTLSTDQVETIRSLKSSRDLQILTSGGEHIMNGSGNSITPSNVTVKRQSSYGISRIRVVEIESELIFSTANLKEVRSFAYQFSTDRYVADSKTKVAHHLFGDGHYPVDMAYLRSYADTQANFLFMPREDGEMAVLSIDTVREVLAWSRFTTTGDFKRVCTAVSDLGDGPIERLYAIVERTNGVFLEYWTEDDVYVDCAFTGTNGSPITAWTVTPSAPLALQTVQIVGDGLVQASKTIGGGGAFTLDTAASEIVFGLGYTSTMETMKFVVAINGASLRGRRLRKVSAIIGLLNSSSLNVDAYAVPFRNLGSMLLDQPLPQFTGAKRVRTSGISEDQTITLSVTEPLPCTVLSVTTLLKTKGDFNAN